MSEHKVTLSWQRGDKPFEYQKYSRDHTWKFDGGHEMSASAAPAYLGNPANVDPEEAFVASLSSCHMLTFLAIACKQKFVLDEYTDEAVGHMEKNSEGKMAITRVELHPKIKWSGDRTPHAEELDKMHHAAHDNCFIANSVKTDAQRMEKIVSLCKRRGFIFQSSEIYGGLNGLWDYGPLGTELKRNVKDYWWRVTVRERDDVVGLDGAILMNRAVWKASGHEETFSDPMVDCRTCKTRLRADQLADKNGVKQCPNCGGKDLTEPRPFNLMFKTYVGATEDESSVTYLRPETAQAIFVQFKNVLDVSRKKLPFGIAQIGKAFRNEINPRNFTSRSREFEQMELEYFCRPEQGLELLEYWLQERLRFYRDIGLSSEALHVHKIPPEECAHYSKGTYDIEFEFPFGIQELEGVAYRTDYDLNQHQRASGKPLDYFDEESKQHFIPHVV